ncbi:hypothetical protein HNP48_004695 [Acidovorax soli]|uniref:Uncharacterized protein n=1 Tax=Acidovorax soli TaxID=592050 RepID=A0A7X0PHE7_9BURK|nr:hypothetical protein [Acidovorax soli]MBB6561993.1 hypothetical protein [Acidovorax soli]
MTFPVNTWSDKKSRSGRNETPRTLDIIVTRKTVRTVYYTLFAGGKSKDWRIPPESTFDYLALKDGQGYRVDTVDVFVPDYSKQKYQQGQMKKVCDWVTATPITPKPKLQARTAKQREAAESMPPMAAPDLFIW